MVKLRKIIEKGNTANEYTVHTPVNPQRVAQFFRTVKLPTNTTLQNMMKFFTIWSVKLCEITS